MSLKRWVTIGIKTLAAFVLLAGALFVYQIWTDDFLLSGYSGLVSILRVSQPTIVTCSIVSVGLVFWALAFGRTLLRSMLAASVATVLMIAATATVVIRMDGKAENVFLGMLHTDRFLLLNPDTNRLPDTCNEFGPIVRYEITGQAHTLYLGIWPFRLTRTNDGRRFHPCKGWLVEKGVARVRGHPLFLTAPSPSTTLAPIAR